MQQRVNDFRKAYDGVIPDPYKVNGITVVAVVPGGPPVEPDVLCTRIESVYGVFTRLWRP